MLIVKLFLPLASPGLVMVGTGLLAIGGAYNTVEVAAVICGLGVVAIAGIFTIRSNVAKIWREQAEGEEARGDTLRHLLEEATAAWAAEVSKLKLEFAAEVGAAEREAASERDAKERALADLDLANLRTDQTPVLAKLDEILNEMRR